VYSVGRSGRGALATDATSAPQNEHEKRPGASGVSQSAQTTVLVVIVHLASGRRS
jgi:hypothetical protein